MKKISMKGNHLKDQKLIIIILLILLKMVETP